MKIDGSVIAADIYQQLIQKVENIKRKGITPHLVIIYVGNNPASQTYITQKKKWGEYIRAQVSLVHYDENVNQNEVIQNIKHLNNDPKVHGIIVQRPLPSTISKSAITEAIDPKKDVDGFRSDSIFQVPVAIAVEKILEKICELELGLPAKQVNLLTLQAGNLERLGDKINSNFLIWLKSKSIVIIGKGETAGKPIINHLTKMGISSKIIDSKTNNPEELINKADIIISAVGKANIIKPDMIKKGAILIGVGQHLGTDGKLNGDYDSLEISEKASYYTPATGGVGPVNVACLFKNLLKHQKLTVN